MMYGRHVNSLGDNEVKGESSSPVHCLQTLDTFDQERQRVTYPSLSPQLLMQ